MDQSVNIPLAIDKAHTVPQRALTCRPGLGGLNKFLGPTVSFPLLRVYVASITTSLPDVQIGVSLIFYWQLLPMLEKPKQICHTKVSTNTHWTQYDTPTLSWWNLSYNDMRILVWMWTFRSWWPWPVMSYPWMIPVVNELNIVSQWTVVQNVQNIIPHVGKLYPGLVMTLYIFRS